MTRAPLHAVLDSQIVRFSRVIHSGIKAEDPERKVQRTGIDLKLRHEPHAHELQHESQANGLQLDIQAHELWHEGQAHELQHVGQSHDLKLKSKP
jgi:hypothetical protein